MKLSKVSGRLILRSAIVAIVMIMALWWVLLHLAMWDWEFAEYLLHFVPPLVFILPSLLMLLFGCLLFFVRDVYIHSVTNKHPRLTVAARVLGALGAAVAFTIFTLYPPLLVGLYISLMAIGGVKLAYSRPKVAGGLMLLAGVMFWIGHFSAYYLNLRLGFSIDPRLPDNFINFIMVVYIISFIFVLPGLLIPGGVLALLGARKKGLAVAAAVGVMAFFLLITFYIFFLLPFIL